MTRVRRRLLLRTDHNGAYRPRPITPVPTPETAARAAASEIGRALREEAAWLADLVRKGRWILNGYRRTP